MMKIHIHNVRRKDVRTNFTTIACRFKSKIIVVVNERELNGKSIMNSLMIENAENLDFIVNGTDEERVIKAIRNYFGTVNEID